VDRALDPLNPEIADPIGNFGGLTPQL